jgi:hypothetical protein
MTDDELIQTAEKFLKKRNSRYVQPGEIGERLHDKVEVIFLVLEPSNPNMSIDPPDIRVWVYPKSGKVELIYQM